MAPALEVLSILKTASLKSCLQLRPETIQCHKRGRLSFFAESCTWNASNVQPGLGFRPLSRLPAPISPHLPFTKSSVQFVLSDSVQPCLSQWTVQYELAKPAIAMELHTVHPVISMISYDDSILFGGACLPAGQQFCPVRS